MVRSTAQTDRPGRSYCLGVRWRLTDVVDIMRIPCSPGSPPRGVRKVVLAKDTLNIKANDPAPPTHTCNCRCHFPKHATSIHWTLENRRDTHASFGAGLTAWTRMGLERSTPRSCPTLFFRLGLRGVLWRCLTWWVRLP